MDAGMWRAAAPEPPCPSPCHAIQSQPTGYRNRPTAEPTPEPTACAAPDAVISGEVGGGLRGGEHVVSGQAGVKGGQRHLWRQAGTQLRADGSGEQHAQLSLATGVAQPASPCKARHLLADRPIVHHSVGTHETAPPPFPPAHARAPAHARGVEASDERSSTAAQQRPASGRGGAARRRRRCPPPTSSTSAPRDCRCAMHCCRLPATDASTPWPMVSLMTPGSGWQRGGAGGWVGLGASRGARSVACLKWYSRFQRGASLAALFPSTRLRTRVAAIVSATPLPRPCLARPPPGQGWEAPGRAWGRALAGAGRGPGGSQRGTRGAARTEALALERRAAEGRRRQQARRVVGHRRAAAGGVAGVRACRVRGRWVVGALLALFAAAAAQCFAWHPPPAASAAAGCCPPPGGWGVGAKPAQQQQRPEAASSPAALQPACLPACPAARPPSSPPALQPAPHPR
jgi:hypothetical protein